MAVRELGLPEGSPLARRRLCDGGDESTATYSWQSRSLIAKYTDTITSSVYYAQAIPFIGGEYALVKSVVASSVYLELIGLGFDNGVHQVSTLNGTYFGAGTENSIGVALSDTKAIIVPNYTSSTSLYCAIVERTGDSISITYDDIDTSMASNIGTIALARLGENSAILFTKGSSHTAFYYLEIVGNTVTATRSNSFTATVYCDTTYKTTELKQVNDSQFILIGTWGGTSQYANLINVSGTTIDCVDSVYIGLQGPAGVTRLDDSHAFSTTTYSSGTAIYCHILTVGASSITAGTTRYITSSTALAASKKICCHYFPKFGKVLVFDMYNQCFILDVDISGDNFTQIDTFPFYGYDRNIINISHSYNDGDTFAVTVGDNFAQILEYS